MTFSTVIEQLSLGIAILALLGSAFTAWLTLLRRGAVRMTQPTVVFFGPDGGRPDRKPLPKIFLRTLLYSTADRGQVVETMFVTLTRGKDATAFGIWVYGDPLVRGSGVYVGREGLAANHHFLLRDDVPFRFTPGPYDLEVFATTVRHRKPQSLWRLSLAVSPDDGRALAGEFGLYFDWNPQARRFEAHVDPRPQLPSPTIVQSVG